MNVSTTELLTRQFYDWEKRGRGWTVWPEPVDIEPPFRPFFGHFLPSRPMVDDGQVETPLSWLAGRFLGRPSGAPPPLLPEPQDEPEPESTVGRDGLITFQALVPPDLEPADFEPFLLSLSLTREPIAFEFIGQPGQITIQFTVHPSDASLLRRQFQAFFSRAALLPVEDTLVSALQCDGDAETAIVEFGLAHEFMRPLAELSLDPYVGLLGALSELEESEIAVFQVLFGPVRNPWAESVMRAVTDNEGEPFFLNAPEMVKEAQRKVSRPLYAAIVRLATQSADFDRAWEIARNIAGALHVFTDPAGNELIPLTNDEYPSEAHEADLLSRQSRRSGMLLNAEELTGFVHLPSVAVSSPTLRRLAGKTKAAPSAVRGKTGLLLGHNIHNGEGVPIRLTVEQRVRHCHLIGTSGTGKSTLLFNLIRQDVENGEGLAVLDPHGDLIDQVLGIIPEHRIADVVLFDPTDEEYSIAFNVLSAHSDLEKNLLASDLVSVFRRLSTSWGDQLGSVLQNAILAFLESSRGGTLADLRRFLLEPKYREEFLSTGADSEVVYYWRKAFPQLAGNKSVGPVLTRLESLLSRKTVRYIVSQRANRLDFANLMDSGKIFLAKLAQGQIGEENAYLLGSLLVSKFQQTAMSRQAQTAASRRDYWLYADEFQHFITPTMATILSGARKYRLGLILAHQELRHLHEDMKVASAVSNCGTRVVFRVGDDDARKLADGFAFFEARDLQNLETGQAICRVERSDFDFNLSVPFPEAVDEAEASKRRQQIITRSREQYCTPRAEIEAMLVTRVEPQPSVAPTRVEVVVVPKAAEAPKPSEVPKPALPQEVPAAPEPPRDLGRGGAQHKTIQERIQAEAQTLGFFAEVERQLSGQSMQAADLVLRKGELAIAVEISVTTTVDHEFGNVKKCLAVGFSRVAVVSPKAGQLKAIEEAVQAGLGSGAAAGVSYHTPYEFIVELRKLAEQVAPATPPAAPQESTARGYKVRRHGPTLSPEERKTKEDTALRMMAETMKRKR